MNHKTALHHAIRNRAQISFATASQRPWIHACAGMTFESYRLKL